MERNKCAVPYCTYLVEPRLYGGGGGGGRRRRRREEEFERVGLNVTECAVVVCFNNAFCLRDVDEVKHTHARARGCRER